MVHDNNRPFACTAENCDARFVKANDQKQHLERNHSEHGIQRRKRCEECLAMYLTSVGICFDREQVVHFCSEGSKKLARVDFVIYKPDRMVAVECDVDSHKTYGVLCDVWRMLDIATQHSLRSELPLHFVRFNPNAYAVDGRAQKPKMGECHRELLLAIEAPVAAPFTVTYVCYDTTGGVADVTRSDEFPPDLRESCRTHIA
jgi:hypothetical protein